MAKKIEKFDLKKVESLNYYELINYIADYVQEIYNNLYQGSELKIPISMREVIEKLEIELDSWHGLVEYKELSIYKTIGKYFDKEQAICYDQVLNDDLYKWNTIISRLLAYFLVQGDSYEVRSIPISRLIDVPALYNDVVQMMASSLVFPWEQATTFLLEKELFEQTNTKNGYYITNNWVNHLRWSLEVTNEQAVLAYYHYLRTINAKTIISPQDLASPKYEKLTRKIANLI